jgi:hypothetical protein
MRSTNLITSRAAILLALVLGGCEGTVETPAATSTLAVSADCQKAQDDCAAAANAVAGKAQAQAKACADSLLQACGADPTGAACKSAQDACKASLEALKTDGTNLGASCGDALKGACGATTASTSIATAAPSQACLDSVAACSAKADVMARAQQANGDTCRASVEAACMTVTPGALPSAGCNAAIQGCLTGASGAGQQAVDLGLACAQGVTKACGGPKP